MQWGGTGLVGTGAGRRVPQQATRLWAALSGRLGRSPPLCESQTDM